MAGHFVLQLLQKVCSCCCAPLLGQDVYKPAATANKEYSLEGKSSNDHVENVSTDTHAQQQQQDVKTIVVGNGQ